MLPFPSAKIMRPKSLHCYLVCLPVSCLKFSNLPLLEISFHSTFSLMIAVKRFVMLIHPYGIHRLLSFI
uniref:Uncharacterized protein n=1 Tax=Rhizophora mucronata TaxID=61149 RepID=A0A2P2NUL1_RHIMU